MANELWKSKRRSSDARQLSLRREDAMIGRIATAFAGTVCLMAPANPANLGQEAWIRVPIPNACKFLFYGPPVELEGMSGSQERPDYQLWDPSSAKPMAYKDPRTSIYFYVESDGRHVSAVDSSGKLLWVRNPFEDAKLCPYRIGRPTIHYIAASDISSAEIDKLRSVNSNVKLGTMFLDLRFNSSQFGLLDEATGDFIFEGQN